LRKEKQFISKIKVGANWVARFNYLYYASVGIIFNMLLFYDTNYGLESYSFCNYSLNFCFNFLLKL
jgi:hypothetical protein